MSDESTATYIDVSKRLGKVRNKVYRIGVELEGGWPAEMPSGAKLTHDGSVRFKRRAGDPSPAPNPFWSTAQLSAWQASLAAAVSREAPHHVGELPSSPLPPKEVATWIRKFYPPFVNDTCGLHVHMSFGSRTAAYMYQLLMDKRYQPTILEFLGRWAVAKVPVAPYANLMRRLRGENTYCKTTAPFHPDAQAMVTSKSSGRITADRYTAINYCYGLHQTIECRVLPMFENVEDAIEAIQLVMDITSAFLVSIAAREKPLVMPIQVEEDIHQEEFREII